MHLHENDESGGVSMEALSVALEATQDVVVITEADRREGEPGHRILYVNAAFERMTGYSKAEAIGRTCAMLQGPKTDLRARVRMRKAFTAWQSVREELINYRKDGSEFVVELQIDPLADETGWYTHWISVQRDVTERRRREERQSQSEERIRLGVQVARLGLAEIDYDTGMADLSPRATYLFGFGDRRCTVSREQLHQTFHPDDAAALENRIAEALDPRGSGWFEMDHRVVWPGGEVRWLRVRKQIWFKGEDHKRRAAQGTLAAFDVTLPKRAEAVLRESQRRFRDLAGGVAHAFNNLLTAIAGHSEMLHAINRDPETRLHATAIHDAATTASQVTQQLLDLSGRHRPSAEALDVNKCLSQVVEVCRPTVGTGVELKVALAPDAGAVRMGRTQLHQVLLNLLLNARDAVGNEGLVSLSTARVPGPLHEPDLQSSGFVQIDVTDSGGGIPEEVLGRVFEPYFSTKAAPDGPARGLGLAIVYTIVGDAGGSITAENAEGGGARFTVLLPRLGEEPTPDSGSPAASGGDGSGVKTVLLAEDDRRVRDLLHHFLSAKGFQVLAAEDGQAALEMAQAHAGPISLLISDVRMPRMDGPALARAMNLQIPQIPTLLLSGFLASASRDEKFDPQWHFLQKPFSLDALLGKLTEFNLAGARPAHPSIPGINAQ